MSDAAGVYKHRFERKRGGQLTAIIVLFQGKRMIITIALGEANPIRRLTARDNDLFDSQFAGGFNDVVRTQHVPFEALVIRH